MPPSTVQSHGTPVGRGRRRPAAVPALLAALAAFAAGCSAAPAASSAPAAASPTGKVPCKQPPAGSLPDSSGSLTQDDSGVYCLAAGGRIDVFLTRTGASGSGASATARWSQISTSDPAVLAPVNSGMLTAPMGVTPGLFHAVSAGQARLQSRLPDGRTWQVTIETLPG